MGALTKAELQRLGAGADAEPEGDPIPVQFNPTSLSLQLANSFDGGNTQSRQSRQYQGTSSTTMSVDLVFDTSDEGTTDEPRSVREKTNPIAQFLLPSSGSQEPPPRVRFHWGDFVLDGVMSEMSEEIDLFSSGGVPLRSKVSISIKEQNPVFNADVGAAAGDNSGATTPGAAAGRPGTSGGGGSNRTAAALANESAANFAARLGLDPAAWRAIAGAVDDPLSLPLGAEIDFSASLSAAGGVGLSAGFEAGVSTSFAAAAGLEGGAAASLETGFSLTAAGGTGAAINTAAAAQADSAATAARRAFDAPAGAAPASAGGTRSPLRKTSVLPSPREQASEAAVARQVAIDRRAASYGAGVPLRERFAPGADQRAGQVSGSAAVAPKPPSEAVPVAVAASVPAWEQLPAAPPGRSTADAAQAKRSPTRPCGCRRRCSHGKAWA